MSDELLFYQSMVPFKDFSELSTNQNFHSVPESWYVIITDVRGSTKAIQEGRYKQVNIIGASCISSAVNVMRFYEFPFVFGGDGATMLIPQKYLNSVCDSLSALKSLAESDFNLELRVGFIAVQALYAQGHSLLLGKYELSPGNYLAQFKGSALTQAETMIKNNIKQATILESSVNKNPDIQGLSCRLSPLKSKHGVVLTLLCMSKLSDSSASEEILKEVLMHLRIILNNDFQSACPVSAKSLHWLFLPKTLKEEIKLSHDGHSFYFLHFIKKVFFVLLENTMLILNRPIGAFNPEKYKSEIILNSDFKKFDGTLRMVIDCSLEQAEKISALFERLYKDHKIFYGTHRSKEALMTCMVQSATNNLHTHFIDGSDGGYAMAAVMFKKQLKESG